MTKQIIIVVILSVVIGIGVYLYTKESSITNPISKFTTSQTDTPTPSFTPTPLPLNSTSNLEEELEKLTPRDFSEDFQNLRNSI